MTELRTLLAQHPRGLTLEDIAGALRVTERSARRYLSEIDVELESVVERPSGRKRWRVPAVDIPRRVSLRRTQAFALLATRPMFDALQGSALYEEIDLAAETLLAVARRPGRGPNAGVADPGADLERRFRYLPFSPPDYSDKAEDLDHLFDAVANLRAVSCRVPGPEGLERRQLHPYALLIYKESLHCLAHDVARSVTQAFPFEVLSGVRSTGKRFTIPDGFHLEDFVQGQFGLWMAEGPAERVVIEFDALARDYPLTREIHPSQSVEELPDGRVRLTVEVADLTEVVGWVVGLGPRAVVIEPKRLRDRVVETLRAALDQYPPPG